MIPWVDSGQYLVDIDGWDVWGLGCLALGYLALGYLGSTLHSSLVLLKAVRIYWAF